MLDTTPKVSREIIITCCLFLGIFIIGTIAFDLYTQQDTTMKITSATVRINEIEESQKNKDINKETQKKQIGVYSVVPSFSFVDEYHLVEEYDGLQKEIRNFHKTVEECTVENHLQQCLEEILELPAYASWLREEDCESTEEALFYDVTETFSQCLQSEDTNCLCLGTLHPEKYALGEYTIPLYQESDSTLFTFVSTDLAVILPEMSFAIEGQLMNYDEYIVHVEKEGAVGGFSSLEPSTRFYIYKQDATTLSVESQTTFSTYETTRAYCRLNEQHIYKFCVQSETNVPTYNAIDETTTEQPLVYLFAVSFS